MSELSPSRLTRTVPALCAGLLLLPLATATTTLAALPAVPPVDDPVGVNLSAIEYWTSGFATADLAKRGQEWLLSASSTDPARINAAGWPLEASTSRVVISTYQRFERKGEDADDYMVLRFHEGDPGASTLTDVDAFGPGVTEVTNQRDPSGTIIKEYTVTGAQNAITLRVNTVNSRDAAGAGLGFDPDIQLWVDKAHMRAWDQDPEQVFNSVFLDRLQEASPGTLRTSTNWCRALHASVTLLASGGVGTRDAYDPVAQPRLQVDAPRWSGALPVPWEVHAWLANEIDADLWVSIPFIYYSPTDTVRQAQAKAYIQEMAETLRDELEPGRTLILEYSNEMWNSEYGVYRVLEEKEGQMTSDSPVRFVVDAFTWWSEVWNDDRVEFTSMGFTGDTNWVEKQSEALKGLGLIDAVGCAGYYFPKFDDAEAWGDGDIANCGSADLSDPTLELAAALSMLFIIDNNNPVDPQGFSQPGLTHALRAHGDYALQLEGELGRRIGLYVYEGGPSLRTNCPELQAAYASFSHDSIYSFWLLYYELLRFVDGFRTGPAYQNRPLNKLVSRFTFHAFCQPQNPTFGDFLLLTDIYAGQPGVSVVDPQIQWKFEAVKLFNATH